jgi:hypothetical protein
MNISVCSPHHHLDDRPSGVKRLMPIVLSMAFMLFNLLFNQAAQAVPSFARQTGQSCVACHAGGQYPELTSYGRLFKLTGYTIGERGNPLAVMATASLTRTQNSTDASGTTSTTDGVPIVEAGSVFVAGKLTDNIGGFPNSPITPTTRQLPMARITVSRVPTIWTFAMPTGRLMTKAT